MQALHVEPYADRCDGPEPACAGLPTVRIVLHNLITRMDQAPMRVCSYCTAALLITHGCWPEGAPSPLRVVDIARLSPLPPAEVVSQAQCEAAA